MFENHGKTSTITFTNEFHHENLVLQKYFDIFLTKNQLYIMKTIKQAPIILSARKEYLTVPVNLFNMV